MIWIFLVASIITIWRVNHLLKGTAIVAHDERGLTKLLDRHIERKLAADESDGTIASLTF